ncbi:hypothetical protein C8J57DRAFT_1289813 [Mycena rebaudengoi]|nr:hypothetical protein C8J57DRAFT_1289813 [Mycena rebaudengoi]
MLSPQHRRIPTFIGELVETMKKLDLTAFAVPELDTMEKRLQLLAAKLRGARNALASINRLPPELLSDIFSDSLLHVSSFLPLVPGNITQSDYSTLPLLLQVCRAWRGVIASCPRLWSKFSGSTNPLECIRRSSGTDLTVYIGLDPPGVPSDLVNALIPHIPRICEFHFASDSLEDIEKLHLFSSPAPRLRSLTIDVNRDGLPDLGSVLPPIFAGRMPKLKQVALGHFSSWPLGYFQRLTHLCLYNQKENNWPSTSEFLDFLRCSPLLEELALIRGGPIRSQLSDVTPSGGRRLALKRLQRLNLGDWPSSATISRFLSHLTIPRKASMYVWGDFMCPDEDISSFLPMDTGCLRNLKTIKEWIFVRRTDPTHHGFKLIVIADSFLHTIGGFHPSQILPSALSRYPTLGAVKSLKIREDSTFPALLRASDWRGIFLTTPALQELLIFAGESPECTRAVVSALRPFKGQPSTSNNQDILCPELKTVEFIDELDLPFFTVCAVSAERLAQGAAKVDFKFMRGVNPPPRRRRMSYRSDSDSGQDFEVDFIPPGSHTQSVKFIKLDAPIPTPLNWPTEAADWVWSRQPVPYLGL